MLERFDPELLDPDDPFEIDRGNRPHLAQRPGFAEDDVYDVWWDDPVFFEYEGEGSAEWLLVGEVPGRDPSDDGPLVLVVPLSAPKRWDPTKARPVTLYVASRSLKQRYFEERRP
jgi:hypothetical protein